MIEAKVTEQQEQTTQANTTPAVITVSGIINDLDNGIDRDGIAKKYGLDKTEVKIMFQHPALKGKRVKKKGQVKELRFKLVDDVTPQTDPNQTAIDDYTNPQIVETQSDITNETEDRTFNTFLNDGNSK